jgi:hypothetical protein
LGSGKPLSNIARITVEGDAMLPLDSYRELLSERGREHHVVASAWFVVVAIAVFLILMA